MRHWLNLEVYMKFSIQLHGNEPGTVHGSFPLVWQRIFSFEFLMKVLTPSHFCDIVSQNGTATAVLAD